MDQALQTCSSCGVDKPATKEHFRPMKGGLQIRCKTCDDSIVVLAHKIHIKPDAQQRQWFARCAGVNRFAYNWYLAHYKVVDATRARAHQAGEKPPAWPKQSEMTALMTRFKRTGSLPWLYEALARVTFTPAEDVQAAYSHYYKARKNPGQYGGRKVGKPRWKKKKGKYGDTNCSYYLSNQDFEVEGAYLRLKSIPKALKDSGMSQYVRMTETLRFAGKIMGATMSRRAGKWYIAIQVEVENPDSVVKTKTSNGLAGIDLGIKNALFLSCDQEPYIAPKPLAKYERRLKIYSRAVTRKLEPHIAAGRTLTSQGLSKEEIRQKLPGKNLRKAQEKLSKLHAKVSDIRREWQHKTTSEIVRRHDLLCIEDLNVAGMLQGNQSKALADVGMGEIRRQIEYKAKLYGTTIVVADRWYPSSKTCSQCGFVNRDFGREDIFECPECGYRAQRDVNASKNLENLARKVKEESYPTCIGEVTPGRYEEGARGPSDQEPRKRKNPHTIPGQPSADGIESGGDDPKPHKRSRGKNVSKSIAYISRGRQHGSGNTAERATVEKAGKPPEYSTS